MTQTKVRSLIGAFIVAGFMAASGATLYAYYSLDFFVNGNRIDCHGWAEDDESYPSAYVRIYSPSGALLDYDAVASPYYPYVHALAMATPVGPGTYSCIGEFHHGGGGYSTETKYVTIP